MASVLGRSGHIIAWHAVDDFVAGAAVNQVDAPD
jgi:hypothetical protein